MNIQPVNNYLYNAPKFKGYGSSADNFIKQIKKEEDNEKRGNFIARNFGSMTGECIGMSIPILYEIYAIHNMKKLKKAGKKLELKKQSEHFTRNVIIIFVLGQLLAAGLQRYFNSKTEENYSKIKRDFRYLNKNTNAKLSDELICSGYKGAVFNGISGEIKLNKNIMNDPIESRKINKLIRHELVHARQYETVARSKDGVKKINYSIVRQVADNLKRIPFAEFEFENIYNDIKVSNGKYKNTEVSIGGAKVNFEKFVEGVYIIMKNPKAGINDVPMIINEDYYNQVIKNKGKLTPQEERKANLYYQAMLDYPPVTLLNAFNPLSKYRQNLLEKEAYKENPSWFYNLFA